MISGPRSKTIYHFFFNSRPPTLNASVKSCSGRAMSPGRCLMRSQLPSELQNICFRLPPRLSNRPNTYIPSSSLYSKRRLHGSSTAAKLVVEQTFIHDYFSANNNIDRGWLSNPLIAHIQSVPSLQNKNHQRPIIPGIQEDIEWKDLTTDEEIQTGEVLGPSKNSSPLHEQSQPELPHRRRQRLKAEAKTVDAPVESGLPLDASSRLTTAATSFPQSASLRRRLATYLSLAKPRLSFLILLTTTTSYSLYPIPDVLSTTATGDVLTTTLSTSTLTLLYLTTGTFLSCASANTLNMLYEPSTDALMTRTRNRPLVQKLISAPSAFAFAAGSGVTGITLLYLGTNPTVAALSALNIVLYSAIYTPMKRLSPWNTWIGALVGAIPPLMGWSAAAGTSATTEHSSWRDLLFSTDATGGWLLAALLFAWQFPHFNSLSHGIRNDYRKAGLKMICWMNPARNARVALRYSLAMFPICAGLYAAGYVNVGFLVVSTACNVWMTREAMRFWKKAGTSNSARPLFWASVWQLPLVLIGALVFKEGVWQRFLQGDENEDTEEVNQKGQSPSSRALPSVIQPSHS